MHMKKVEAGGSGRAPEEMDAFLVHRAGQVVLGGPVNVLFVVLDIEVHTNDVVYLAIRDSKVQVLGRTSRRQLGVDPVVRSVVDNWLGAARTTTSCPGRQRDAYEALEMLHRLVGTEGVYDTALNIVTEATRIFPLGAGVNTGEGSSFGINCVTDKAAIGKLFGQGGPKAKNLGP
ncbi:hypothetical protein HPB50_013363 [Hyalomma asiaticum]|uniref:Uncharacterized protein n=1 Tax=Hyalomma asiaticum TaxID=266040 RepID=A0ACB7RIY9_HYAAI|nr:hypothetical protein HPB50_013363 [Hyalomma asiaticum]